MNPDYDPQGGEGGYGSSRGLITQNEKGTLFCPKNIICSQAAAYTIYQSYRENHLKRILLYSAIEGLIAGNPPYNPIDLQKHGLTHITNVNNLDARSLYERAALAYWNLLYSVERMATFFIEGEEPEAKNISNTLSEEFDYVVKKWVPFTTLFNTLISQIVKFGVSPVLWPDERDWRWKVIEMQRFFVSTQAPTNTEELTCVCVESIFTAQYLYEIYVEYKDKATFVPPSNAPMDGEETTKYDDANSQDEIATTPWNIDALELLLLFYANQSVKPGNQIKDMMDLQQRIQENDFVWDSVFSDGFRLVTMLYREYDGKISHYMFDRNWQGNEFLFFIDRQYNSFEEALVIFTASPGEFTIHSNRGVGHKIFPACQAMMRLDCASLDMGIMTSTPFIKTLPGGTKDMEPIKIFPGSPTNIGAADFAQGNFGQNLQQVIQLSQYFLQKINYNAANSGDDPGLPDRDKGSISGQQAVMQSFREFGIPKNNIQHFYTYYDLVEHNMAAKMIHSKEGYPGYEYAKEWKERCIAKGVPPQIFETKGVPVNELPPGMKVRATRVSGDGSTLAAIMGFQALTPVMGEYPEDGRKQLVHDYTRAIVGSDTVNAYMPLEPTVGGDVSVATLENGIMRLGESAEVSPTNDQKTHILTHFALLNDTIQRIKQQEMTPLDGDKIFTVAVPHTGDHIQIYSQSIFAKTFIDQIKPAWDEIVKFATNNKVQAAKLIQAEIRKRQEQAAKQDEANADIARKDQIAAADIARADRKVESQVERAAEANVTRGDVMRQKVQSDAEIQREKVQLEAQNDRDANYASQKAQLEQQTMEQLKTNLNGLSGNRPAQFDFEELE